MGSRPRSHCISASSPLPSSSTAIMTSTGSSVSSLVRAELASAHPRYSPCRLCRRDLPDGRIGRGPRALLGRPAPPRHPAARRLPCGAPTASGGAPAPLRDPLRQRLHGGHPRLLRSEREAAEHLDQRRDRPPLHGTLRPWCSAQRGVLAR